MSKHQYLIVGANFINKGAEAMLKTVKYKILETNPDAEIYAICHPPEREIAKRQGIHPITDQTPAIQKKVGNLTSKVINKIERTFGGEAKPYADYTPMDEVAKLKNLKLAIDVSGFAYGDKRGYIQPLETQKVIDYCKTLGAKYIFMPQAWGSFEDKKVAENCRKMITSADRFYTRDHVSRKYVAQLLAISENDVPLLPDIAFHFPIPDTDGMAILQKHGFPTTTSREAICISPNMRVYERMPGTGIDNAYVKSFCEFITYLKDRFEIVLIPNEIFPDNSMGKDDQFLCKVIYDALANKAHVTCISGYYSAEEIKAVIRECKIVVASRFHSLVFALSLGIPSLAISWSHKYRELFRLFQLDEYVLEDKGVTTDQIITTFEKIYTNKEAIKQSINTTLPKLKAENEHVFELLKID